MATATFDQCVKAYEDEGSAKKASLVLGVSHSTVHRTLRLGGYRMKGQKFDEAERDQIRQAYAAAKDENVDLNALASALGRPKTNICREARALGLTKQGRKPTAAQLAEMKKQKANQWAGREHPRGAKGLKHSDEAKAIMSQKAKATWLVAKTFNVGSYAPEVRQASSDRMMERRASEPACNTYSRAKRGIRPDIGPMFFRSKWEANYARYLNWLQARGEIDAWKYESQTFWFEAIKRGVRSYKPDFYIEEKGKSYFVEVKGWMDDKSKTKLKRMKKYYPDIRIVLVDERQYASIKSKVSRLIEGWEP
jgi:hypothetical protein